MLHPIATFLPASPLPCSSAPLLPRYHYTGHCPRTGNLLHLPRTELIEAIAQGLMQQLGNGAEFREGKMYGVLLVETAIGEHSVLKAFSGLLNGESTIAGWVPPIPGRDRVALAEAETLVELEAIKQELIHLHQIPERQMYQERSQFWQQHLAELTERQQQHKQVRQANREILQATLTGNELTQALATLDDESRNDKRDRRHLKQQRDAELIPLKQILDRTDARILELKRQRKERSRHLQAQLYTAYHLTNFAGETASLESLMPAGYLPTGTGDCCAPKLLHYAAANGLRAIALAEFWWGEPSADGGKVPGEFYGACTERCQPIMGFLLSGLPNRPPNPPIVHCRSSGSRRGTEPQTNSLQKAILAIQSSPSMEDLGGNRDLGGNAGSIRSTPDLTILYEDEFLIAIDKPAGLLSVPGRTGDRQDAVLSRLWSGGAGGTVNHSLPIHPSTHPLFYPSTDSIKTPPAFFCWRKIGRAIDRLQTNSRSGRFRKSMRRF
ncbi:hypothetical protein [Leptolyngbya ohadii]|uniref:hypothetical protein n=1 Tax=Leptolyngbya ohadii TaxID=1962290 RepID=UPI0021F0BEBE|nr:hypothetical protein [Leptolyngbya ohadii]